MPNFDIADEYFAMDFDCAARLQWDCEWQPTEADIDGDEPTNDIVE
jgi:hypothetical protein